MTRPRPLPLLPVVLAGLLLVTACTDQVKLVEDTIAAPSPSPSPSPSPTITRVQGAVEVATFVSGRPDHLGFADNPGFDPDLVRARAADVGARLDKFLNGAQRGKPDLAVIGAVWLNNVDPKAAKVLRSGITNDANGVATARYEVTVHVEPEPVLAAVKAEIRREDDTTVLIEFAFDLTHPQPRLQLVGGAETV